jgi:hypothetical protein
LIGAHKRPGALTTSLLSVSDQGITTTPVRFMYVPGWLHAICFGGPIQLGYVVSVSCRGLSIRAALAVVALCCSSSFENGGVDIVLGQTCPQTSLLGVICRWRTVTCRSRVDGGMQGYPRENKQHLHDFELHQEVYAGSCTCSCCASRIDRVLPHHVTAPFTMLDVAGSLSD